MTKTIIAMAAGMGSRFGGLKQVCKFGKSGKTMLDFSMEDALEAGFGKAIFVIRRDIEKVFRDEFSRKYENLVDTHYVFQEESGERLPSGRTKPWGTGHAVLACSDLVDGAFTAINADDYYGKDPFRILAKFLNSPRADLYALAGYKLRNTLSKNGGVSRGICRADSKLNLLEIDERKGLVALDENSDSVRDDSGKIFGGDSLVSMNFWAFPKEFMETLGEEFDNFMRENSKSSSAEFYIITPVDSAAKSGKASAKILPTNEKWQGVTYKEDIPEAEKFLAEIGRI